MQLDPNNQIDSMGGIIPSENFDDIRDDLKQDNFNAQDASHAISLLQSSVKNESKDQGVVNDYNSNIVDKNAINFNSSKMALTAPVELIQSIENDSYLSYLDEVANYLDFLKSRIDSMHKDFSNSKALVSKQSITNSLEAQIGNITNLAIRQGKVAYDNLDLSIDNSSNINKHSDIDINSAIAQAKQLDILEQDSLKNNSENFGDEDLFDNETTFDANNLSNDFVSNEINAYVDSYDNSLSDINHFVDTSVNDNFNNVDNGVKEHIFKEDLHNTFNKSIQEAKKSRQDLYTIKCFDRFDSDGVFKPYKNSLNEELLNSLIEENKDIINNNETYSYVLPSINYVKDDPFKYLDTSKDYSKKDNLKNNLYSIRSFDNYIENFDKESSLYESDLDLHIQNEVVTPIVRQEELIANNTNNEDIVTNTNFIDDVSAFEVNIDDGFDYVDSDNYENYDDINIEYDSDDRKIVDGNPNDVFIPSNADLQAMQRQDFYFKGKEQVSTDDFYYAIVNKDPWYNDIYNANVSKEYILSLLEDSTRTYIDNDDCHWLLTTSTQYRNILTTKNSVEDLEKSFSNYLGKSIKIEFNFVSEQLKNTPKCHAEEEYLAHIINVRNKIKENNYLRSFIERVGNNVDNINIFLYKDIKTQK